MRDEKKDAMETTSEDVDAEYARVIEGLRAKLADAIRNIEAFLGYETLGHRGHEEDKWQN